MRSGKIRRKKEIGDGRKWGGKKRREMQERDGERKRGKGRGRKGKEGEAK